MSGVTLLAAMGHAEARDLGLEEFGPLYDPVATSVRGIHAFFLLPGDPAAFGLPASPEAPVAYLRASWVSALLTSAALIAVSVGAFLWG